MHTFIVVPYKELNNISPECDSSMAKCVCYLKAMWKFCYICDSLYFMYRE